MAAHQVTHIHLLHREVPLIFRCRAKLTQAAPAHPCARGIPFILNITPPQRPSMKAKPKTGEENCLSNRDFEIGFGNTRIGVYDIPDKKRRFSYKNCMFIPLENEKFKLRMFPSICFMSAKT